MKKVVSLALTIAVVILIFTTIAPSVSAAVSFPSVNSSAYCEFKAVGNIPVYRNSTCTTRGTCSPASSYAAEIWSGDVCHIISFTPNYIQLKYPTSSGMKTGYIRRSSLISVTTPSDVFTSRASVTTYVNTNGTVSGYTETNDTIYKLGVSGNYTMIIYTAKSGSRAWKLAYVKTTDYARIKGTTTTTSTTLGLYVDALLSQPVTGLNLSNSQSVTQDVTIYVTSNSNWTVTSDQSWIKVNKNSGSRNGSFTISISPCGSRTASGTVTIKAGSATKVINVQIKNPPALQRSFGCSHTSNKYNSVLINDTSANLYWVGVLTCTKCGIVTSYAVFPFPN